MLVKPAGYYRRHRRLLAIMPPLPFHILMIYRVADPIFLFLVPDASVSIKSRIRIADYPVPLAFNTAGELHNVYIRFLTLIGTTFPLWC